MKIFRARIWRNNAAFFGAFLLFLLAGAVLLATLETGSLVLYFSDHRVPWSDFFFRYATVLGDGFMVLPVLILLLFVRYRYALVLPLLGLSVSAVSQSAKAFFAAPRPLPYFRELGMAARLVPVDGVALLNGHNSFPSGHAMTAFAFFTFLALCLPYKNRTGPLLFLAALVAGISRVYLGQHFLKDVYLGAILGVLLAVLGYALAQRLPAERWSWLDKQVGWKPDPSREYSAQNRGKLKIK